MPPKRKTTSDTKRPPNWSICARRPWKEGYSQEHIIFLNRLVFCHNNKQWVEPPCILVFAINPHNGSGLLYHQSAVSNSWRHCSLKRVSEASHDPSSHDDPVSKPSSSVTG